ncbi:hypothetical protein N7470_008092 [Penicillium chermesinum]|nr:hypothetical protein N7470_008092 [Penicillium chermesinum]
MIFFSAFSVIAFEQMPYPFISWGHAAFPFLASSAGAILFLSGRIINEEESKALYRTNIVLQGLLALFCVVALAFASSKHHYSHTHPIDILIHQGSKQMDQFLGQAKTSKTLGDAVAEYRKRYHQHPPPGFDKWYEYATNRSSVIIDDFDEIYKNLLPFRAIPPAELRDMTQKLATNPFNDLGAISIRNGTARVQEGIKPTHAWMVAGAATMIEKFSEHLPDMDLVFNLNDEPRVAIPWKKLVPLKRISKGLENELVPEQDVIRDWTPGRQDGWGPIEPADQTSETIFTDGAWRGVFDPYVSEICPPSSRALTRRVWNRRDTCLECAAPHTMGQFPINYDLASDICHQPDLAFLHGLLISPASFKVSQDLIPIFSQSALKGFSDILFPSPWNYVDKTKYEPTKEYPDKVFERKENSLFWIGSTSEGVSRSGEWQGMPRQRFAHLVNNNTNQVSVLLPTSPDRYRYKILNGDAPLTALELQASVHIADPIARCGADCDEQHAELGTAPHVDFQSHWSHRYLFDLDGAGFSGRFLPFLQSNSLPFKTGLFRQWFDSRIVSWYHFVPIDIRLHGFWSTLAYFAGVPGSQISDKHSDQGQMWMKQHLTQGWWIAQQGRDWAQKALRKEDMEIYFFRLLLEWGRMTDDQRDVLGFIYQTDDAAS